MDNALHLKRESGFTMLELLLAVSILAVGLLGVGTLQLKAIKTNGFSMRLTDATALIEDKIEDYNNTPYANIATGSYSETGLGESGIFTRTSNIQGNVPLVDTKTITVSVSWTDTTSHAISLRTIVVND